MSYTLECNYEDESMECCGLSSVFNFPLGQTESYEEGHADQVVSDCVSELQRHCAEARTRNKALMVATTIPSQGLARRALLAAGFHCDEAAPRPRPADHVNPIILWSKALAV